MPDRATDDRSSLLIVSHSRRGSTAQLATAVERGTRAEGIVGIATTHLDVVDADSNAVTQATGLAIVTPARFGSMAGLVKDFFERIYYDVLETTSGMPYVLVIKGDTDGAGAVSSIERIAAGLRWRRVLEPLVVLGSVTDDAKNRAEELGATFALGLAEGVF
jgi:multimeric flavodoxin WrbA